jgi:hypothetical protein
MTRNETLFVCLSVVALCPNPIVAQRVVAESPGIVYAATLHPDGSSSLVLRRSSNAIERYSRDGNLTRTYFADRVLPLAVRETCDFTTDSSGNLHALVLTDTGKSFRAYVVKFGGASQSASVVTLEKPLTAFGLDRSSPLQ